MEDFNKKVIIANKEVLTKEQILNDEYGKVLDMYNNDSSNDKVNFSIGSYKDDKGNTLLFKSVQKAESIVATMTKNKDYAVYSEEEVTGKKEFIDAVQSICFGELIQWQKERLVSA